ncbi:Uncharacterized protein APZ42_005455, partial [Daphnia magna]
MGDIPALSTIDEVLDVALLPAYKTNLLLSCFSTQTLQTVLSAGLTTAKLADHEQIIGALRARCRQLAVWCDLSRKCDFAGDCCARCEATRILGQIVTGVADNDVRIKLLEKGDTLTLDGTITILRTAETSQLQAAHLQ